MKAVLQAGPNEHVSESPEKRYFTSFYDSSMIGIAPSEKVTAPDRLWKRHWYAADLGIAEDDALRKRPTIPYCAACGTGVASSRRSSSSGVYVKP